MPLPVPPEIDEITNTRGTRELNSRPVVAAVLAMASELVITASALRMRSNMRSAWSSSASRPSGRRPWVCSERGMLYSQRRLSQASFWGDSAV